MILFTLHDALVAPHSRGRAPYDLSNAELLGCLHGRTWTLGKAADRQRYAAIAVTTPEGYSTGRAVVSVVCRIERIVGDGNRRQLLVVPLRRGHPIFDHWFGKQVPRTRNPVRYMADQPAWLGRCGCGCGEPCATDFLPGHDLRALSAMADRHGGVLGLKRWVESREALERRDLEREMERKL